MTPFNALKHVETAGLSRWGDTEFAVRHVFWRLRDSALQGVVFQRGCKQTVERIYAQRGAPLPQWALCQTFDQLRGRPPFDADQVDEARLLRKHLSQLYTPNDGHTHSADPGSQRAALQRCILLANLLDARGEGSKSHGLHHRDIVSGPFTLPPGPFERLWSDLKALLSDYPPLLGSLAVLERLGEHEALFPHRVDVARELLWPLLVGWAFSDTLPVLPAPQPRDMSSQLSQVQDTAELRLSELGDLENWFVRALEQTHHQRTGSYVPSGLKVVAQEEVLTAGHLSRILNIAPRTAELVIKRFQEAGVVHCIQQTGRLRIYRLKDPVRLAKRSFV